MKIKTFLNVTLAATLLIGCVSETAAQKRTPAQKRTTTTKKTTSTASKGSALTAAKLTGSEYFALIDLKQNAQYVFNFITLKANEEAVWNYIEDDATIWWTVSGNNLKIGKKEDGGKLFNVTSTNGGKTFSGTYMGGSTTAQLYNITETNGKQLSAQTEKDLVDGKYYAFLGYQRSKGEMILGFPVTVKFTPDDEEPGEGTFKITGDNKALAGLGTLKFDYKFGENALVTSKTNGEQDTTEYAKWTENYIKLILGPSKAGALRLYLIKK